MLTGEAFNLIRDCIRGWFVENTTQHHSRLTRFGFYNATCFTVFETVWHENEADDDRMPAFIYAKAHIFIPCKRNVYTSIGRAGRP